MGFGVLPKDTSTCGSEKPQSEPGSEPLTSHYLDHVVSLNGVETRKDCQSQNLLSSQHFEGDKIISWFACYCHLDTHQHRKTEIHILVLVNPQKLHLLYTNASPTSLGTILNKEWEVSLVMNPVILLTVTHLIQ